MWRRIFELRPTGEVRWTFTRSDCSHTNFVTYSFSPAQDYDVLVQGLHGGPDCISINGGTGVCPGAWSTYGVPAFTVVDPFASGAGVYFSNFSLDQYGW